MYNEFIPNRLLIQLKEKNFPLRKYIDCYSDKEEYSDITYADVFDFALQKGYSIEITRYYNFADKFISNIWDYAVIKTGNIHTKQIYGYADTWNSAADLAIEEFIKIL